MRTLVFGDSFAINLKATYNLAVSGTTIGEYSIYPVDGNSLISKMYESVDLIKNVDTIILCYGINDVSSITVNFVEPAVVKLSLIKALDFIKQTNPNAKVCLLSLENAADFYSNYQEAYLREYAKQNIFSWEHFYRILMKDFKQFIKVIPMFKDSEKFMLDDDFLHPTEEEFERMEQNVYESINNWNK